MKIGIFHDTLNNKGGAERSVIELANYLNADLITAGYNTEINKWIDIKIKIIDIGNFSIKYSYLFGFNLEAPLRFFMNRNKFEYDVYIFSQFSSIFAAKSQKFNIWYCLTPNRILYDLKKVRIDRANIIKKFFYLIYIKILLPRDKAAIKNMKKIIADSITVQARIKKYYKRESKVIYPSIKVKDFVFKKYGNFYLSVSRLIPEKRLDLIAKAFVKMPNKNLVIVGNGSERKKILKIINNHNNIRLLTNVNDKQLKELYSTCLATIYMPLREDFGLVPLESMSAGKPCIAADEGGCKETIINFKTGFLIKATEAEIIKTVKKFNVRIAYKMKPHCLKQAKKFNSNGTLKLWKKELENF